MKVKALKTFNNGKSLCEEGEVVEMTKEVMEMLNSTPHAPLVEEIKETKNKKTKED